LRLGKRLGQRDRIGVCIGDGVLRRQILQKTFAAVPCPARSPSVLHDFVLATGSLHGAAELGVVSTVIPERQRMPRFDDLSHLFGITVENDTKLRRAVQAAGGKYKVVKNTLPNVQGRVPPPKVI